MKQISQREKVCENCGRRTHVGHNVSHSQRKTKRLIRPNLQMHHGRLLCVRCIRTLTRKPLAHS